MGKTPLLQKLKTFPLLEKIGPNVGNFRYKPAHFRNFLINSCPIVYWLAQIAILCYVSPSSTKNFRGNLGFRGRGRGTLDDPESQYVPSETNGLSSQQVLNPRLS